MARDDSKGVMMSDDSRCLLCCYGPHHVMSTDDSKGVMMSDDSKGDSGLGFWFH